MRYLFRLLAVTLLVLPLTPSVHAQTAATPALDGEELSPLPFSTHITPAASPAAQTSPATSITPATPSAPGHSASANMSTIPDIVVTSVTIVVPDSTGLERDRALALAARQAMPRALAQMDPPVGGDKATAFITNQGDLTRYVKTVQIVKEVLVPTYTLTANLTYDGRKLVANLGGRIPPPVAAPITASSGITPPKNSPAQGPAQTHTVTLLSDHLADQARAYALLNTLPNTLASYTTTTLTGATFTVKTPLSLDDLEQALVKGGLSTQPGPASSLTVSY